MTLPTKKENNNDDISNKFCIFVRRKFAVFINTLKSFLNMSKDFAVYLWTSGFALCAFLKACGTATWGTNDVLNASFSLVEGDESETSRRMGVIFSCAGLGCLIGPFLSNATIAKGDQPHTLQLACIGAFLFLVMGWLGIANAPSFKIICAFTIVRCMGESIIWMNATLLLQVIFTFDMIFNEAHQ